MRLPRLFSKKRGHRRTGATEWGALADGIFHAALLAAGLFFGGLLLSGVVAPEWRINNDYVATGCTIIGKGVARVPTCTEKSITCAFRAPWGCRPRPAAQALRRALRQGFRGAAGPESSNALAQVEAHS